MSAELSYPKDKIKILLLENIHQAAVSRLKEEGYSIEEVGKSLATPELIEKVQDVHVLGIRSKTKVPEEVFKAAKRLLTVGCFGIGTNQVALDAATSAGVPVFNAPFSSTRSVAELAIAYVLMLARGLGKANTKMHQGVWEKSAKGSHEIRGKV